MWQLIAYKRDLSLFSFPCGTSIVLQFFNEPYTACWPYGKELDLPLRKADAKWHVFQKDFYRQPKRQVGCCWRLCWPLLQSDSLGRLGRRNRQPATAPLARPGAAAATAFWSRPPTSEGDNERPELLLLLQRTEPSPAPGTIRLRLQEQKLLQQLGPDHPRVKVVRVQIELLQQQPPLSTDSNGLASKLATSRLEERRLLQQFGPDHPDVQKVRDRVHAYQQRRTVDAHARTGGIRTAEPDGCLRGRNGFDSEASTCASCCSFGRRIPTYWSCNSKRGLLRNFGPDHPHVKATAEQIDGFWKTLSSSSRMAIQSGDEREDQTAKDRRMNNCRMIALRSAKDGTCFCANPKTISSSTG